MNSAWINQLNTITDRAQLFLLMRIRYMLMVESGMMDVTNVTVANSATSIPRASIQDPNDNDRVSDRYVEDGFLHPS
jgi:hypothetical protein